MNETMPDTPAWGDQGNGTYKNPVLFADYSDPDVIRVGEDYYMICSESHFMGIPLLHSTDLVNWRIVNRLNNRLLPGTDGRWQNLCISACWCAQRRRMERRACSAVHPRRCRRDG